MSALILDGRFLSKHIERYIHGRVQELQQSHKITPGLAVILVGDNPASQTYVARKSKVAKSLGFRASDIVLPQDADPALLHDHIAALNKNPEVHGILLQLPLPPHLQQNEFLDAIAPEKDVDGLHSINQGLLMRGEGLLRPCTPQGSLLLIDLAFALQSDAALRENFSFPGSLPAADLSGKSALVIGRSVLVGKPVASMLLERNATVSMAHSRTKNLPELCASADIIVAAIGKPELIPGAWLHPGAIVIDVGINRMADGKLVGDVHYESAVQVCAAITPVPGGVGQLTVAMLMMNTLVACETGTQKRRERE